MKTMMSSARLVIVGSVLSACAGHAAREDDHTIARTTAHGGIEGRPTLGMPIAIPGRHTCLVPYSLETRKRWFEDQDPHAEGLFLGNDSYLVKPPVRGGSVRWHNAILSDLERGEQWTVLSQRGVIEHWGILGRNPRPGEPFVAEALVFIATLEDSNHDGVLDDRDASVAIVTDGDGRNPRQVTPGAAQVWNYVQDEETSRLYLLVVADTDSDGKYTTKDAPVPFAVDLGKREKAAPAVSEAMRSRAESMLM